MDSAARAVTTWYRIRSCTSASESERCRSIPTVNSPSRRMRRWLAKLIRCPDRLLELGRVIGVEVPGDPKQPLALALDQRRAIQQRRKVRVRKGVAQDHVCVEMGGVIRPVLRERNDDVGVLALRLDVRLGVPLPGIQLSQHLVRGVSAASAVSLHLPRPPQLLGRRQRDANVVEAAQRLRVEVEQPLDQEELRRTDVCRRLELARLVAVDRLENRLTPPQVREVLSEDVQVVGVGVQRRDTELAPLPAVIR